MMRTFTLLSFFLFTISFSFGQYELKLDWLNFSQESWGTNIIYDTEVDSKGNVYAIGSFSDTFDVDPGPNQTLFYSAGFSDIFIQKYDSNGVFLWAKHLGGPNNDAPSALTIDHQDNLYITGFFTGRVDFDPGPGVFDLVNPRSVQLITETFILKLDQNGDFIWANRIGGNYYTYSSDITITKEQKIYVAGSFRDTADFDPSIDTLNLIANGIQLFLASYEEDGGFISAGLWGSANFRQEVFVESDLIGNVYLAGYSLATNDLDPSPKNALAGTQYPAGTFISKLNPINELLWSKSFEAGELTGFELDNSDQMILTGSFTGDIDFDPDSTDFFQHSVTLTDPSVHISKYSTTLGTHLWTKVIGGSKFTTSSKVGVDDADNIYAIGEFQSGDDLDPGQSTAMPFLPLPPPPAQQHRQYGLYCVKLDPAGNFVWPTYWETNTWARSVFMSDIHVLGNDKLIITGTFTDSIDFDLGSGAMPLGLSGSNRKLFMMKQGTDSCSGFGTWIDSAANFTCQSHGFGRAKLIGGTAPFVNQWNEFGGPSALLWDSIPRPGRWSFSTKDAKSCARHTTLLLTGNLPFPGVSSTFITPIFRPGRVAPIFGHIQNNSCDTTIGKLACIIERNAQFFSSNPPPVKVSQDTVFIDVPKVYLGKPFRFRLSVVADTFSSQRDSVTVRIILFPRQGDTTGGSGSQTFPPITRRVFPLLEPIRNSYDPNDISVSPKGTCDAGYITESQRLTYKIRFQNTGNAPAIDIAVLDTLSPYLNLDSLKIIASSHDPMVTEILPGNIIRFFFKDIYLADSISNEPESHGYIIFSISPKPSIVPPAEISNRVGIYFDFNPPVITNTVRNTIIDSVPMPDTSYVDTLACRSLLSPSGIRLDSAGRYIETISSNAGCDSVVILDVAFQYQDTSVYQSGTSAVASLSGVLYQWIDCNNQRIIPGATNQQFSPSQNGSYAVILSNGTCLDTSECILISNVGLGQNDFGDAITVYPNPTSGKVTINSSLNLQSLKVEVFNMLGKRILSQTLKNITTHTVDITGPHEIYFVRLSTEDKRAEYKIVKR